MPSILLNKKEEPNTKGIIVSNNLRLTASEYKPNENIFAFGKNADKFILPNILNDKGSFILTDPNGEYYEKSNAKLVSMGYIVKPFDARGAIDQEKYSTKYRYNPLNYINNERDAEKIADLLIRYSEKWACFGDTEKAYVAAKRKLLTAIIVYVCFNDKNFSSVFDMLKMPLTQLEERLSECAAANKIYLNIKKKAENLLTDLAYSLAVRLHPFSFSDFCCATENDNIILPKAGEQRTAVFAIYDTDDDISKALASILITQSLSISYKNHLSVFADIDNLYIPKLIKITSQYTAERNFSIFIMVKRIDDLLAKYGEDNSAKFLKDMAAILYTGEDLDDKTKKWLNLFSWVKFPKLYGNQMAVIYNNELYRGKIPKIKDEK